MMEKSNSPNEVRMSGATQFNKLGQAEAVIDQDGVICASGSIGDGGRGLFLSRNQRVAVTRGAGRAKLVFEAKLALSLRQPVEGQKKLHSAVEPVKNDYTIASALMCNNSWLQRADDELRKCYRRLQISSYNCSQKLLKLMSYILAPGLLYKKA